MHAKWIAAPVARLLATNPLLRVFQPFDNSVNLTSSDGDFVSLVKAGQDLGPFSIDVTPVDSGDLSFKRSLGVARDSRVEANEEELSIGDLQVCLQTGQIWDPRLVKGQLCSRSSEAAFGQIHAVMRRNAPERVFWPENLAGEVTAYSARIREAWLLIRHGIRNERPDICASGARIAAGVGIGLTPTGDDFLMGILLALYLAMREPEPYSSAMLAAATGRTVQLSLALMNAAARGDASLSWHALTTSILINDGPGMSLAAEVVLSAGHTSGADALLGFLMALQTVGRANDGGLSAAAIRL